MRLLAVVLVSFFAVAHAENTPPQPPKKAQAVMHYRTLEKMLRRFSSVAGEPRTRG